VLVLFDEDLYGYVHSELPKGFKTVPLRYLDVPQSDSLTRPQLGRIYRDAATATASYPDLWVVNRHSGSIGRERAARFADLAAAMLRRRVLRDSLDTPQGKLEFSRWVDRPGGVARRQEIAQTRAWVESVLAVGLPKRTPITRPFSASELLINPDTLGFYLAKLPDTSFYSIGGCSDVEIIDWNAPAKLGAMGPGAVPPLLDRITDPNSFVRERVQEALLYATQDERILARTGGEYIKFYDQPSTPPENIVRAWWGKFGRFWASADTVREDRR
jgi:hypothetical protein